MSPLEALEVCDWSPALFATVWAEVRDCQKLTAGINPALIFEGCDTEDLTEALETLRLNLYEVGL